MTNFFFDNLEHYTSKVKCIILDPANSVNYLNAENEIFESGISHQEQIKVRLTFLQQFYHLFNFKIQP